MMCNEKMAMEDGRLETRQMNICEYEREQY